jgi:hypothetical protein
MAQNRSTAFRGTPRVNAHTEFRTATLASVMTISEVKKVASKQMIILNTKEGISKLSGRQQNNEFL